MARLLLAALLAFALLMLALGGALFYFSYGFDDAPPERTALGGLAAPVRITWGAAGDVPVIEADSLEDAYAALGYVHAQRRAWPAALWRQTATGRLGEWLGDGALPLDRHARRLGFAALARETYAQLPAADRAVLDAYARGMNAGLRTERVRSANAFVLLGVQPESWQPWHALAVERLYAWLATPPPPDSLRRRAPEEAAAFFAANDRLRGWLHAHGFEHSVAWAVRDTAETHVFHRLVTGASALPLYQEVVVRPSSSTASAPALVAASVPGMPFFPSGKRGAHWWALLPSSTAQVGRAALDTAALRTTHQRLVGTDGRERLLAVRRSAAALPLEALAEDASSRPALRDSAALPEPRGLNQRALPTAPSDTGAAAPDTAWQVRWAGLAPGTDLQSWQALVRGEAPTFRLLRGDGLRADSSGAWQVMGEPQVQQAFAQGVVLGNTPWAASLARALEAQARQNARADVAAWTRRDSSAWAARLAPALLASIDSLSRTAEGATTFQQRTDVFGESITYLRNWDYSYDAASIAASIFDTWAQAYREATGRLPRPGGDTLSADTVSVNAVSAAENRRRFRALSEAVIALDERFGDDLRQWRWENVAADTRRFPVWSADTLLRGDLRRTAATRYAPLTLPGRGHPSALNWGASPVTAGRPAPAAWEGWTRTGAWDRLVVRRRRLDADAPLGRYRVPERPPDPLAIPLDDAASTGRTTTLVPASSE